MHAAIDLGSNTFRLLIARPRPANRAGTPWETVQYMHRIVRLGEDLHACGRLGQAAMTRALAALTDFADAIRHRGLDPAATRAVATSAMREAENAPAFAQRIRQETGIAVRVISGEEEAGLSLAGAAAALRPDIRADMLLFDIGGGSTEFIRARNSIMQDAVSRKLGVVRLAESLLRSDPPSSDDYAAMRQEAMRHLAAVESAWTGVRPPRHLVGTAGTVTTLAAIDLNLFPYDADIVNNHVIGRDRFRQLRDRLLGLTHAGREAIPAIDPGRADLIIAGLAIIESIMERWHYDRLITVDAGLLEGVWLQAARERK